MKKFRVLAFLLVFVMIANLVMTSEVVSAKHRKGGKPTKISLNVKSTSLYINQTLELKVATVKPTTASVTVTWSSSNPKVATVDANGVVTGVKAGTAKITARSTTNKKIKATAVIKVKKFKPSKLTAKVIMVRSSKNFLATAGYETKAITSYTELRTFISEARDKYVAAGYGTTRDFYRSSFYRSLKKYSRGYFKTKVLYLLEASTIRRDKHIKVRYMKRVQIVSGDLVGKLYISYNDGSTNTDPNAKTYYQQYFVEVKKSVANTLSGVELVKQ